MEALIFPKTRAALNQPDRVRRAKSRGDSGKGSSFSNRLRKEREGSSGSSSASPEDPESSPDLAAEEVRAPRENPIPPEEESGPLAGGKLIDVRV